MDQAKSTLASSKEALCLKKLGTITGIIFGLLAAMIVSLFLYLQYYQGEKYSKTQVIENVEIEMRFQHAHPALAEYKKTAWVTVNSNRQKIELHLDTGGHAWVNVFLYSDHIILHDWGPNVFKINTATGDIEKYWVNGTERWATNYHGKFIYEKGALIYLPKEIDASYIPTTIKGG